MLKSLLSAFLMYSRIPVFKVEWKEENRRYSLGFFPLVGAVIGAILIAWRLICSKLGIGQLLFSAGAVFIPVLVTGGIHLDGYCDVNDALASYADKEKRIKIMSDPHIGSFAVIRLILHLIVQTALFSQIDTLRTTAVISCGYLLSRSFSGLSAITMKSAKSEGTLQSFVRPSDKKVVIAMNLLFILTSSVLCVLINAVQGISGLIFAIATVIYFRYSAYRNFGGITGDLCGWFLQKYEILFLAAVVFSERITELWL